jgi:FkbM family methyltransferase
MNECIVLGHRMFLDWNDTLRLSKNGIYEPMETKLVMEILKEGDVVVDVGAHIGYYTLIFARCVGEKGKVYAFEPEPINFFILSKNVEVNGYKNVLLFQKAVADFNGRTLLFLDEGTNTGDHRLYPGENRKSIEVDVVKLDDVIDEKISFVKVDVQGVEWRVLKGMRKLIESGYVDRMLLEYSPYHIIASNYKEKEFLKDIRDLGFKIYGFRIDGKGIKEMNDESIMEACNLQNNQYMNIYCQRK